MDGGNMEAGARRVKSREEIVEQVLQALTIFLDGEEIRALDPTLPEMAGAVTTLAYRLLEHILRSSPNEYRERNRQQIVSTLTEFMNELRTNTTVN